ncbi:MAG TPA: PAS domain S-box protein [Burkholderiales bacterium]|nr:PAS domain S-box protein [Burkholderiales bacterium]
MKLRNLKIGAKLGMAFGTMIVLMAGLAGTSVWLMIGAQHPRAAVRNPSPIAEIGRAACSTLRFVPHTPPSRPTHGRKSGERSREESFRLLVESVKDYAIFMLDREGYVLTWNAGAERIKGYTAEDIVGRHFSTFYPAAALERNHPQYELDVATREGRFEEEGWRVRKDGTLFWANVVITALRDADGTLLGFGKVTRDLTQRREAEESLRQSEERFRLLVEGVRDYAIFMLDPNGYIATWNAGAQRIKGYAADEIIGEHFSKFYPADAIDSGWPEHELQVATAEGRFQDEGWRLRKDGSRFWANVTITALHDDDGRLRGFAKLTRDLTDAKHAQALQASDSHRDEMLEAERSARMEAQRTARMKDEFLATLSHELRTPLNAILGWTQLLRQSHATKPGDVQHGLEVIERNARAQVQLVDDLLDLSRILAGQVRLDVQRIALADVIAAAVESALPTAHAKSVRLEKLLDPRGSIVAGDPARLQQVVWNLLSNAVKFTPKGGRVQVLLERVDSHIEISVVDTGIGIPLQFLPHVFERFSQKDGTTSRDYGGLGLGLAICKQLVELHGGTIHAKSRGEGQGSTFTVKLPLLVVHDEPETGRAHPTHPSEGEALLLPGLKGVSVLVVDDEKDARELVTRILENQGARVTALASAEEALRAIEVNPPDVLVSDIGMPVTDGYQLMRKIRSTEAKGRRLPALALTAFARAEDRKRAMLAGYQAHLAKPFDTAELVLMVADLAARH